MDFNMVMAAAAAAAAATQGHQAGPRPTPGRHAARNAKERAWAAVGRALVKGEKEKRRKTKKAAKSAAARSQTRRTKKKPSAA